MENVSAFCLGAFIKQSFPKRVKQRRNFQIYMNNNQSFRSFWLSFVTLTLSELNTIFVSAEY